jgi:hypothetical protein
MDRLILEYRGDWYTSGQSFIIEIGDFKKTFGEAKQAMKKVESYLKVLHYAAAILFPKAGQFVLSASVFCMSSRNLENFVRPE